MIIIFRVQLLVFQCIERLMLLSPPPAPIIIINMYATTPTATHFWIKFPNQLWLRMLTSERERERENIEWREKWIKKIGLSNNKEKVLNFDKPQSAISIENQALIGIGMNQQKMIFSLVIQLDKGHGHRHG